MRRRLVTLAAVLLTVTACSTPDSAAPASTPESGVVTSSAPSTTSPDAARTAATTSRSPRSAPGPTRSTTAPSSTAAAGAVRIASVYDGDTLRVHQGGNTVPVRVLGIDAPELRPKECWGEESRDAARALLLGQSVVLTADPTQGDKDRYGRLLRYVQLPDGRDLAHTLLAEGDVIVYEQYPVSKTAEYEQAQAAARAAREGLWAACWG
ncbi:MAG TPA: thermonuclease family protein [Candidatus Limnocylindrales bacterium]